MSRSRFSAPGTMLSAIWDGHSAQALVLATSRHRSRLSEAEGRRRLAAAVAHAVGGTTVEERVDALAAATTAVSGLKPYRWRSVTRREIVEDTHMCDSDDPCEPGSWCSEGAGADWMLVLSVPDSTADDIADALIAAQTSPLVGAR